MLLVAIMIEARRGERFNNRELQRSLEALVDRSELVLTIPDPISGIEFPKQTIAMSVLLCATPRHFREATWRHIWEAATMEKRPALPVEMVSYEPYIASVLELFQSVNINQRYAALQCAHEIVRAVLHAKRGQPASRVTVTFRGGVTILPAIVQ